MNWIEIKSLAQLEEIKSQSAVNPVIIFKHSTRCSTSRMTLDRLERNWNASEMTEVKPFFLDLLSHRQISNFIAEEFGIEHESPQVLIVFKGEAVQDLSHFEIEYEQIKKTVRENSVIKS
jgi:bacillithiol system protein YtxJ